VEGESFAVVWKPDDGEEKMEKDRNLNFYSSTDEAVGVLRPRLRLRPQVQGEDGAQGDIQQDEPRYSRAKPRRQRPAPPLWCRHRTEKGKPSDP
jgi:hypothetical protein